MTRTPTTAPAGRPGESSQSKHERAFATGLRRFGPSLPEAVQERAFHPARKWRFDFAWPDERVAVEIHGAIFRGKEGGHTSGRGMIRDAEKITAAQLLGWIVLVFTPDKLTTRALAGSIDQVREALALQRHRQCQQSTPPNFGSAPRP